MNPVIKDAMITMHTVTFNYTDSKGKKSVREAEPYEVKNGRLFGWCLERNAIRQFMLESITNPVKGKSFAPRMPIVIP